MGDLSREEKIAKLERQIREKDDAFDKEQGKRLKRTFFVLCGVIYFLMFYCSDAISISNIIRTISHININSINFETIKDIFYVLFALTFGVGFFAGLIMFVSYGVWYYITVGAMKRVETIARLEGELNAIKYYHK